MIEKFHLLTIGVVVLLVVVIIIATTVPHSQASYSQLTLPDYLDPAECPEEYGSPRPVILVSIDGFRADYIHRGVTPTLAHLAELGVHAPYMLPVYPSKTFTNHYSIVTGLYPESHGIVENVFFDFKLRSLFSIHNSAAYNGSWWNGEPIWNTLNSQGKRSATYFWPGSEADIGGRHPTEWFVYNRTVSYRQRVSQVLMWVSLPSEERPSWVSLYLEEPDKQSHISGPSSPGIDGKLAEVEEAIRGLVRGLAGRNLLHCVNLLLVSDHGMAETRTDADIDLATSVPEISQLADVIYGPSPMILLKNPSHEAEVDLVTRFSTDFSGKLRAYHKEDLPKRLHYFNSSRIAPIILKLQPGYRVKDVRTQETNNPPAKGLHGYDYIYPDMGALFIGYGPDLVQGMEVEGFHNIELYNLMCVLTGITPAPNNGTWGALHHLLASPPPLPPSPPVFQPALIEEQQSAPDTFHVANGCESVPSWTTRRKPPTPPLGTFHHLPWGPPTTTGKVPAPVMLVHQSHVTGYSVELKIPLWTSFTLTPRTITPRPTPPPNTTILKTPWIADDRLPPDSVASCQEYDAIRNITMTPLFPPKYGQQKIPEEAFFITNALGINSQGIAERWCHLTQDLIPAWVKVYGPLNVVLGPVLDYNHDGLVDTLNPNGSVAVPSDLFAIVTRCLDKVPSLARCSSQRLDSIAFIYPQKQTSWVPTTSNDDTNFAMEYSARVKDVELLTNLNFLSSLPSHSRLSILLRIQRSLWPLH